jgi:phage terminase large subunit
MNIIPTAATAKIAKLNNRIRIVQGGTSAGKTFAILQFLISYAYNVANQSISIVAESIPHIRRGALRDFKIIATDWNHWRDDRFNKSTLTFTFENGSYIEFFSADQLFTRAIRFRG